MVSINKSFLYGICFASATWIISLYLFWQLNKTTNTFQQPTPYSLTNTFIKGSVSHANEEPKIHNFKYETKEEKQAFKDYINSLQLHKNLQPVYYNPVGAAYEKDLMELGMVKTMADKRIKEDGYHHYAFNVLISNNLSYQRHIPDTRNKQCQSVTYPSELPSASIIICFYNEHNHTLLRTIYSILNRTQPEYLKEIILVDDYSDISNLHEDIENYVETNFNGLVKLYKTERREGLIRARMFGARKATGKVIVFLDSHIEVNVDWLRPLLAQIKENRTNIAIPIIDIINADTFTYTASPLVRGSFNWGLHFQWESLPTGTIKTDKDLIKPIKSPAMAGGLFAIDKQYFIDMGEYDAGMNIWGGENIEISFRMEDSNSTMKTESLCKVCGDKASGKHYGVASCDGCRGFFKRSIRRNLEYVCKENGMCVVDVTRRNQCQACRFRKCLQVNMKRDAVQHERAPRSAQTNLHQYPLSISTRYRDLHAGPFLHGLPLHIQSPSVIEPNTITTAAIQNPYLQHSLLYPSVFSTFNKPAYASMNALSFQQKSGNSFFQPNISSRLNVKEDEVSSTEESSVNNRLRDEISSNKDVLLQNTKPLDLPILPDRKPLHVPCLSLFPAENIYESAAKLLFLSIKWARTIPSFLQLSYRDQSILLEESWSELFVLTAAQWALSVDEALLVSNAMAPTARHSALEEDARKLREIISRLTLLRVDHTEHACLKALVLFKKVEVCVNQHMLNFYKIKLTSCFMNIVLKVKAPTKDDLASFC